MAVNTLYKISILRNLYSKLYIAIDLKCKLHRQLYMCATMMCILTV
jgi:hypothetical protein